MFGMGEAGIYLSSCRPSTGSLQHGSLMDGGFLKGAAQGSGSGVLRDHSESCEAFCGLVLKSLESPPSNWLPRTSPDSMRATQSNGCWGLSWRPLLCARPWTRCGDTAVNS